MRAVKNTSRVCVCVGGGVHAVAVELERHAYQAMEDYHTRMSPSLLRNHEHLEQHGHTWLHNVRSEVSCVCLFVCAGVGTSHSFSHAYLSQHVLF